MRNHPGPPPCRAVPDAVGHPAPLADVFEPDGAPRPGGDQGPSRLVPQRDAAGAGVLFAAVDACQ